MGQCSCRGPDLDCAGGAGVETPRPSSSAAICIGHVLNLLGICRGTSFACDSANGLGCWRAKGFIVSTSCGPKGRDLGVGQFNLAGRLSCRARRVFQGRSRAEGRDRATRLASGDGTSFHANGLRRPACAYARRSVKEFQSDSSRWDSPVRILYAQPRSRLKPEVRKRDRG